MEKEFIPYKESLALKELGFDEPCFAMWTTGLTESESSNVSPPRIFSSKFKLNDTQSCTSYVNNLKHFGVSALTFSQAFRWFREKHNQLGVVWKYYNQGYYFEANNGGSSTIMYKTYEEAELECLKKLIEIVKNKQNE